MKKRGILSVLVVFFVLLVLLILLIPKDIPEQSNGLIMGYPIHRDITVTYFWVGEGETEDNDFISNVGSAWDEKWMEHYGGIDDPDRRAIYFPSGFKPLENPFYFALPYNDFDEYGNRKGSLKRVYWSGEMKVRDDESVLKNRWIKIFKGDKIAYAQWEDVGPFEEDDIDYVFGDKQPKSIQNQNAGLDVSPAVRDYLDLDGIDKVDWQFVDFEDVPDGPWKMTITTSQIYWG